jgi:hypothetical protein
VVLLRDPGGGKTTTVLAFTRAAAGRRLADPEAPVPVYAPVRTWDGRADLPRWLAWSTGLDADLVADELRRGRLLVVVDGLASCRDRAWAP